MRREYIGQTTLGVLPNIKTSQARIMAWFENSTAELQDGPLHRSVGNGVGFGGYDYINSRPTDFNANFANTIYGSGWFDGGRVVPSSVGMGYIIKY